MSTVEPSDCHIVIAQTYCLVYCITTHLVTVSVCAIWQYHIFFSITVWLHYWSLFYITVICKSARTVSGEVSWYSSLGSTKRTSTHFKPTDAWGNKGQHQNLDCSNYECTSMHGVYEQHKEVSSFYCCRRRSLCTLVAIIKGDLVEFFSL